MCMQAKTKSLWESREKSGYENSDQPRIEPATNLLAMVPTITAIGIQYVCTVVGGSEHIERKACRWRGKHDIEHDSVRDLSNNV